MSNLSTLHQSLKTTGYSATKSREIVFTALDGQEPMTMAELVRRTGNQTDRASVYRTVKLFEKLGIIQKLQIGWKYKLELSDEFHEHHHHIACIHCGVVLPIKESSEIENTINTLASDHGFKVLTHQFELRGLCKNCQKS